MIWSVVVASTLFASDTQTLGKKKKHITQQGFALLSGQLNPNPELDLK